MTANVNIAGITALFEQYAAIHSVDVEGLRALLGRAEPHIRRLQEAQTGQRLVDTPDFDVFAITRRAHFEVTTHSAFLAHLLNPLEAHGQGNLFLKAFLSLLTERLPRWRCPPPDVRWRIERERDRIDIRLAHTAPLSCIVIENKWNAPDEEDQIFRYWQLTHQRYGNQITLIPAVYLTKTGR